jgi:aldehyde:ferredoxin oxidoreductase
MKNKDGYMGKFLRVDLSAGQIREEALSDDLVEQYVGGTGAGIKYL